MYIFAGNSQLVCYEVVNIVIDIEFVLLLLYNLLSLCVLIVDCIYISVFVDHGLCSLHAFVSQPIPVWTGGFHGQA